MSLTIENKIIGIIRVQGWSLRPMLGACELSFGLRVSTAADEEEQLSWTVERARVSLTASAGTTVDIGVATSDRSQRFQQYQFANETSGELGIGLQYGQLMAADEFRQGEDLKFTLALTGTAERDGKKFDLYDEASIHVSKSDWLKKLGEAGVRKTLLIEVPLPVGSDGKVVGAAAELMGAEEAYRQADYRTCVAKCRTAIQELGFDVLAQQDWASVHLRFLHERRSQMSKEERQTALWAVARHYTHQAHHGESEGGAYRYTREDAAMVLRVTASFFAMH